MGVQVPFNTVNDLQPPSLQTTAWVQSLVSTPGYKSPFSQVLFLFIVLIIFVY